MDGIISQQDSYDLPPILDDTVESFLKKNMSWMEMTNVMNRTVWNKLTPKSSKRKDEEGERRSVEGK